MFSQSPKELLYKSVLNAAIGELDVENGFWYRLPSIDYSKALKEHTHLIPLLGQLFGIPDEILAFILTQLNCMKLYNNHGLRFYDKGWK